MSQMPKDSINAPGVLLELLEFATNFWLLVLSILHNYAWDL